MLRILLVTSRREAIPSFVDGLSSDSEVRLELVASGAEALRAVRTDSPHLVIIDSELSDTEALILVPELLMVNAMVHTAVVSPLSDEEFHEASEGLGVLASLPLMPGKNEAGELLRKLRNILGLIPWFPPVPRVETGKFHKQIFLDRWPDIDRILIHYEPEQKEFIRIATPVHVPSGTQPELESTLSEHFGEAQFFVVPRKETRSGNVALETFIENRFRALERRREVKTAELLAETGVDEVRARTTLDGKGAGYALEALGIDVFTAEAATLRDLVCEIVDNPYWSGTSGLFH